MPYKVMLGIIFSTKPVSDKPTKYLGIKKEYMQVFEWSIYLIIL